MIVRPWVSPFRSVEGLFCLSLFSFPFPVIRVLLPLSLLSLYLGCNTCSYSKGLKQTCCYFGSSSVFSCFFFYFEVAGTQHTPEYLFVLEWWPARDPKAQRAEAFRVQWCLPHKENTDKENKCESKQEAVSITGCCAPWFSCSDPARGGHTGEWQERVSCWCFCYLPQ